MTILKELKLFLKALETNFDDFDREDLQDLGQFLADLDIQTEADLIKVTDWFKNHTKLTDTLRLLLDDERELKKSPKLPPNSEASIIQNLFEPRKTNQEVIKAKTNQQDQDKSQQSKQG
ncbi:hypothetical protein [Moorena sp. SIO3I6]|uniref:hypothetical protein n=1 Tax=Moorena sp. SIO3I6 TaxID=2607831 RepID=UPI0013F75850|nr:hypothetical protein [Moorena sp. SIO3I6]NEP22429.1 hypothetical protein [Moorena sp. SIO3I6]